jgi:uncharacterized membrane protein
MAFCSTCGAQIADGTTTCGACSARAGFTPVPNTIPAAAPAAAPAAGASGAMADNVAGMLAYITIIPAIIFLVMEPYNKRPFVRFHSFQNIFLNVAAIAVWIVIMILSVAASIVPILGHILVMLLGLALWLGFFVAWIILLIKANAGLMYKLPFIGDLAEKQANAM